MHSKNKKQEFWGLDNKEQRDLFVSSLARLFGAEVVPQESQTELLKLKAKVEDDLRKQKKISADFAKYYCYYLAYSKYHIKWKPTTRMIERRMKKLTKEKLNIDTTTYPETIAKNLDEAYKCYSNGLYIASYFMIIRTVEIAVSLLFDLKNTHNKKTSTFEKFQWAKKNGILRGFDVHLIEAVRNARNEAAHELLEPTERQLLSAFETVINLIKKLKYHVRIL